MTRTHAARRLLEHGPLMFGEFLEITRWSHESLWRVLRHLMNQGEVVSKSADGRRRRVYQLREGARA